jgi:hypothetical protein
MKTLKPFCQNLPVKIFEAFILLTITCSARTFQDLSDYTDPAYSALTVQRIDLLKQLDFESNIIIVQKDACIQEAIRIDKQYIRLIGLGSNNGGPVILENPRGESRRINMIGNPIEFVNIQQRNFIETNVEIHPLLYGSQAEISSPYYLAAKKEIGMHRICRNIKGLIPVANAMKYAAEDEALHLADCKAVTANKAGIDAGVYHFNRGAGFIFMGDLALTAPDYPCPILDFTGCTNSQALVVVASNHKSGRHFLGGNENEFFYTDTLRCFRMAVSLTHCITLQILYDMGACECDEEDVIFEDHPAGISIPILGTGGGLVTTRNYTSSPMASTNLTSYLVNVPGTDPTSDYGHADSWFGYAADEQVWDVLNDHTWITLIKLNDMIRITVLNFLNQLNKRRPNHEKHEFKTDPFSIHFFHGAFLRTWLYKGHGGEC